MPINRTGNVRGIDGLRQLRKRLIQQTESFVTYGLSVRRYDHLRYLLRGANSRVLPANSCHPSLQSSSIGAGVFT